MTDFWIKYGVILFSMCALAFIFVCTIAYNFAKKLYAKTTILKTTNQGIKSPIVDRESEIRQIQEMSADYIKKQELEQKNRREQEEAEKKEAEILVSNTRTKLKTLEETLSKFPSGVSDRIYLLKRHNSVDNKTWDEILLARTKENKLKIKSASCFYDYDEDTTKVEKHEYHYTSPEFSSFTAELITNEILDRVLFDYRKDMESYVSKRK